MGSVSITLRNIGKSLTKAEMDIAKQRYFSPSIIMMDSGLFHLEHLLVITLVHLLHLLVNQVHIVNNSACDIISTNGMGIAVSLNNKLK